jgi:hypothetical protein
MTTKPDHDHNRLIAAYHRMVERLHTRVEQVGHNVVPSLRKGLADARDRAVEAGELTREEAERLSDYLLRDLHDAADYLARQEGELSHWLRFDLEQIEQRLVDRFWRVADRTRLELSQLAQEAERADHYPSGALTMPGTFECMACGHRVELRTTTQIPPCAHCGGTEFRRVGPGPDD